MSSVSLPGVAQVIQNPFFGESRLAFEGVEEAPSEKKGIQFHYQITALIDKIVHFCFKIFGYSRKTIEIKDLDGQIYHLNRADLNVWLVANSDYVKKHTSNPKHLDDFTDIILRNFLRNALNQKSPQAIVQIHGLNEQINSLLNGKEDADETQIKILQGKLFDLNLERHGLKKPEPKRKSLQNSELIQHLSKLELQNGKTKILIPGKAKIEEAPILGRKNIYNNDVATLGHEIEILRDGDHFQILESEDEAKLLELDWNKVAVYRNAIE